MKDHAFYHQAIYNTHPKVVTIDDTAGASDKNGNLVVIDEVKVAPEIAKLQAEYDAQEYARQREAEYPSIKELIVALYDTEDRAAIDAKRAAVKAKYPKGAS